MPRSKNSILIVEASQEVATIIGKILSDAGYIPVYGTPNELYDKLNSERPGLLLLSLRIENTDTVALLEGIRGLRDRELADIPVMVGSDTGDLVEIGRALRVGVKDYYVKSTFQPENFLAKVAKLIESTNADASVITSTLLTDPTPQVSSTPAPSGTSDTATTRSLPKLLIVEDDKFLRELAVQKLSNANLSVISAMDGEQGLALAESEKPDMILLDILLPGIDGYEVLKRVRANPELKGTRISMLSNFGQREDIQKALSAGADQFMVKANYTLDEIVEEVKKMLSKPRA